VSGGEQRRTGRCPVPGKQFLKPPGGVVVDAREHAIPPLRHEAPVSCPDWIYNNRNQVERLWARLKEWRAIASRYEKTAVSFMGVLYLAAAFDWLKR
jgi:hypothetical protein